MSGALSNSPAEIILEFMIDNALASRFNADSIWPIFYNFLPDTKNEGTSTSVNQNALCVYDTSAQVLGRIMYDGEFKENHGIQIKVRAKSESVGWLKAKSILNSLDSVRRASVTISANTYIVHALSRSGDVQRLGTRQETNSKEFTLNYLVTVTSI